VIPILLSNVILKAGACRLWGNLLPKGFNEGFAGMLFLTLALTMTQHADPPGHPPGHPHDSLTISLATFFTMLLLSKTSTHLSQLLTLLTILLHVFLESLAITVQPSSNLRLLLASSLFLHNSS
jgi:hypothetical protein